MWSAPTVTRGFSPLDEELQLLPGHLTPTLQEQLVRLSTWMPFARAANEFNAFTHVTVSEPSARRATFAAGAAYVAVQTAEVERLERELPPAPGGPACQLVSVDGAMVPLIHHEWAEVKTLAIGRVEPPVQEKDERVVHSAELSYFSRLTDATTFGRLALVETQRRGTETAGVVCAVTDGAEWVQGFIDLHREDAVRILDFSHAAGYVAAAGQALWGEGSAASRDWLQTTLHELKHGSAETVLNTLRDMQAEVSPTTGEPRAAAQTVQTSLAYLEKRQTQMEYARFQAAGYPIGSGSVESANKLVVEARLKGSGMHWARPHVDPMLALRNVVYSDRWDEAWPLMEQQLRQQTQCARTQRQVQHQTQRRADLSTTATSSGTTPVVVAVHNALTATPAPDVTVDTAASSAPATAKQPQRPAPDHPWRRFTFGRTRYLASRPQPAKAKL